MLLEDRGQCALGPGRDRAGAVQDIIQPAGDRHVLLEHGEEDRAGALRAVKGEGQVHGDAVYGLAGGVGEPALVGDELGRGLGQGNQGEDDGQCADKDQADFAFHRFDSFLRRGRFWTGLLMGAGKSGQDQQD